MKIGFVFDDSLDRPDGVQQYVLTFGLWLSHQGHEVHYLVSNTQRTDLANVHNLAAGTKVRFNQNRLSVPRPAAKAVIRSLLDELNLDVLHVMLPYNPALGGRVIKAARPQTALVGTFHIMPAHRLARAGTRTLGYLQRSTLRNFDQLLAVSPPAIKFAKQFYGINATLAPNPVNLNKYKPAKRVVKSPQFKIVFLGRLVERKGAQYILPAIHQLSQIIGHSDFQVVIGGQGPLEGVLKKQIREFGLESVVKPAGFVDEAAKPDFFAQADVAVFPATGGESFGIVLIEAMGAGAGVVLGGNNPGYDFVLDHDTHFLFDPTKPQELAKKLAQLMNDEPKAKQMHAKQQKIVQQYDVTRLGPKLIADYQQALRHRQDVR